MINMSKGSSPVSLRKGAVITAKVMWPDKTDYDLGAEILYRNGSTESLAAFPAAGIPTSLRSNGGLVIHQGDIGRGSGGMAEEVIQIDADASIAEVTFWAYSAQSNGGGSFRKYAVSMEISDGVETVRVDAKHASRNPAVYTCAPGGVSFSQDGTPMVFRSEEYSRTGSENRPAYKNGLFEINGGPKNAYK